MITFITGKPGGGKTLRSLQILFEALEKDERNIVTNVPIKLPELQDFCDRKGLDIIVADRVFIIDDELYSYPDNYRFTKLDWLRKFYLYRGTYSLLEWSPDTDLEDFFKPLFIDTQTGEQTGIKGVLYIIDETRKLYPARNFSKMDNRVFDYFGLHRHLGDDCYLICQFVGQVDKQIRGYGQTFEVIRNKAKEKYGFFKGEARFQRYVYLEPPMKNVSSVECTSFALNKEQSACYSTSSMGGNADQGQRAKGLHIYWLPIGLLAMGCIVGFVIINAPKMFFNSKIDLAANAPDEQKVSTLVQNNEIIEVDKTEIIKDENDMFAETKTKHITSLMIIGNIAYVQFSDGSKLKINKNYYENGQLHHKGEIYDFAS
jgi:hypothetical protein